MSDTGHFGPLVYFDFIKKKKKKKNIGRSRIFTNSFCPEVVGAGSVGGDRDGSDSNSFQNMMISYIKSSECVFTEMFALRQFSTEVQEFAMACHQLCPSSLI